MGDNEQPHDYTKTRQYASIDLATKIISALALVALGLAGSSLQWHAETTREETEIRERNERRYLPMLRSLGVLELTLENLYRERQLDQDGDVRELGSYNAGTKLRFVAESVFVPDGDPDPVVALRPPDTITLFGEGDQRTQLPLRSAAIMYAELMRMKFFYKDASASATFRLEPEGKFLLIESLRDQPGDKAAGEGMKESVSHLNVAPESLPAFRTWLGNRTMKILQIRRANMNLLLQDIRFACSIVIQSVLSRHVDLGDRYVQIRDELEKNRISTAVPAEQPSVLSK